MIHAAFHCTDPKDSFLPAPVKTYFTRLLAVSLVVFSILFFADVKPFDQITFIGGCLLAGVGGFELVFDALSSCVRYYQDAKKKNEVLRLKPWLAQMKLQPPGKDGLPLLDLTEKLGSARHIYAVYPESAVSAMPFNHFIFYFARLHDNSKENIRIAVGSVRMKLSESVFTKIQSGEYVRHRQPSLNASLPPLRQP